MIGRRLEAAHCAPARQRRNQPSDPDVRPTLVKGRLGTPRRTNGRTPLTGGPPLVRPWKALDVVDTGDPRAIPLARAER